MLFVQLFLSLTFLPTLSFAGGSVSFSQDMIPLLQDRPELINPILRRLEITDNGEANKLGSAICPALAGTRLPPYAFQAKERKDNNELLLIVNSNIDFYDREGNIVFRIIDGLPDDGDPYEAVSYRETFSSIIFQEDESTR